MELKHCINCDRDVPIYQSSIIYPWVCIQCKIKLTEDEIMTLIDDETRERYAQPWPGGEA